MRTPAASADVVVVGLGAMGSHALWRLAERGVRAIGVEQFTPGHDRGSSHGESRIIRTAYSEGAGYVPLVLHAWRLWDELEARSGQRLLERCGGLMLGSPSSPWVRGATESAKDHGLRYELLSGSELRERFPQHRVDDGATVKVGLHSWPGIDEPVDPVEGPRPPDGADADRVAAVVEATLPDLRPRPVRMQSCMYTLTPDQHFAVGQRRDLPGLTLLAGFSGHGFKFAPVLGEVAAQLALTGTTDLPIEPFDPHRFDALPL